MTGNLWIGLLNNASLLLALFVVFEISQLVAGKSPTLQQVVNGVLIAAICLAIMKIPYPMYPGLVFDTRTILLSVTALTIGKIPALIAAFAAAALRFSMGGVGIYMGIATILTSAATGLFWRRYVHPKFHKSRWLSIYLMSLLVHLQMVLCVFMLPEPFRSEVFQTTALPVMLLYPPASVALGLLIMNQQDRKKYQDEVRENEEKFRRITENISDVVWTADLNMKTTYVSPAVERLLGETPEAHLRRPVEEKMTPRSLAMLQQVFMEEINLEGQPGTDPNRTRVVEVEHFHADGHKLWLSMHISFVRDANGTPTGYQGVSRDITARKNAEEALHESERSKSLLISHIPGIAYRCRHDKDWTMEFISQGCLAMTGYAPEALIGNSAISFNELICPEYRQVLWDEWSFAIRDKRQFRYEYQIQTITGQRIWVLEVGQAVWDAAGEVEALEGIIVDITETKEALDRIHYMDEHDDMTGLFNRKYFDARMAAYEGSLMLPISLIICDINGIRLINDAFGHEAGDRLITETAKVLQRSCGQGAVLARTGGDEFAAILPGKDGQAAIEQIERTRSEIDTFNLSCERDEERISLAIGSAAKENPAQTLEDVEKEAAEALRRSKLFEQKSRNNAVLSSIMSTMYARSQETEAHSQRMAELCGAIAARMGVPKNELDKLHLFAMIHDIGKIGISDSVLNKPAKLSEEEWVMMRRHPQIGYRIAHSVPELAGVANYILAHHERWDGSGYPYGLFQEAIPLLARILAVVDAYDAMTEDRIYRKAMSREAAIEEIRTNSGTQFDPGVVAVFLSVMEERTGGMPAHMR